MARTNNFWTMRVLPNDRKLIAALAQREGTSASEAVRAAVRRSLEMNERTFPAAKQEGALVGATTP